MIDLVSFIIFLLALTVFSLKSGLDELSMRRSLTLFIVFLFTVAFYSQSNLEVMRDLLLAILGFYFASRALDSVLRKKA